MATSARASGSYFGSPENFARRYSGGYFWYASSRSASACSARAAARLPATWARNARGITSLPYRCSRSFTIGINGSPASLITPSNVRHSGSALGCAVSTCGNGCPAARKCAALRPEVRHNSSW